MTRRRAAVLGAIALAAIGVAIFALTRPEKVTVPTVIGDSLSTAQAKLENRGFDVETRFGPSCNARNTVTEQDPPSGSEADEGSTVSLTVSLGSMVRIPSLGGQELSRARQALEREDLLVRVEAQASDDVRRNRVIDTEPGAGQSVPCESEVTLLVSRGPNLVNLPSLLGLDQQEAESRLRELGLIPDVETENADQPEGEVIGQDPGPGSTLRKGTRVTLIVSTGAGSAVVPNVEGQPEETALNILQDAGLTNLRVVRQTTDEESDDGRVTDQAPPAGTRQPAGQRVTIFVGVFEEPPEPPAPTTTTPTTPEATP
jgi:beta-lactam-binding protein with PASTA domain